jgi:hypothetical protein
MEMIPNFKLFSNSVIWEIRSITIALSVLNASNDQHKQLRKRQDFMCRLPCHGTLTIEIVGCGMGCQNLLFPSLLTSVYVLTKSSSRLYIK